MPAVLQKVESAHPPPPRLPWKAGSELTESPNQDRPNLLRCTDTAVRQTVIQLAATSGISLREYAAMLTALIQANGRAASAQVGDGAWRGRRRTQAGC